MLNITAFIYTTPPHRYLGADLMMGSLLKALSQQGHNVRVLTEQNNGWYVWEGMPVGPIREVIPTKCDVFISIPELGNRASGFHGPRTPYISVCHNTRPEVYRGLSRARPFGVVVNTEHMARELAAYSPLVVYPPIDVERLVMDRTLHKYVTLVNLSKDKGSDVFYSLAQRCPDLPFLGVLGGYGFQQRINLPNVKITPQTASMGRVYGNTRVLLFPSAHESYGMVAAEAAYCGVPSVARPLPGVREALGDSAVWTDFENMDEVESAVRALMVDDTVYDERVRAAKTQGEYLIQRTRESLDRWVAGVEKIAAQ